MKRSISGRICIMFSNECEAYKWYWLFGRILRMRICCFGQYDNAYEW